MARPARAQRPPTGAAGATLRPQRTPADPAADDRLERLIHERTRLAIMSVLAVNATMSFNELKAAVRTTDGNLSVHARKLEEAGFVTCTKGFAGRVPRTEFALTQSGREALGRYLDHMEAIIEAVRRR